MRLISFLCFLTMTFMAYGKPEIKPEHIDTRTDHVVKVSTAFRNGEYLEVLKALPKLTEDFSEFGEGATLSSALKKQQTQKKSIVNSEETLLHLKSLYSKSNDLLKQNAYTVFTITGLCEFFATYEKKYGSSKYADFFSLHAKKFGDLVPSSMISSQEHLRQIVAEITYVPFYECFWLAASKKPEVIEKETWQAFYKTQTIEDFFHYILEGHCIIADKFLCATNFSILSQVALYGASQEQKNILGNIILKQLWYHNISSSLVSRTKAVSDLDLMLQSMTSPNMKDMLPFVRNLKINLSFVEQYMDRDHLSSIHKLLSTIREKIKSSSVVSKL